MAEFNPGSKPEPIIIDKFYGLNESVGETQIELGEAVQIQNFRITKNFKAVKRSGYETLIDYGNTEPVYAWHGTLDGVVVLITTNNGKVYKKEWPSGTNTEIGTLTDTDWVEFFWFDDWLYMLNGTDYKRYNGTTFENVSPYVPTITIETPPAGGGTLFEELNMLTNQRRQEFIGDGTTKDFKLAVDAPDSVDLVEVDGVEETGFGVNYPDGIVQMGTAPADDSLVRITYTKNDQDTTVIKKNKYHVLFGAGNATNVFLWGNPDNRNRRYRSYILDPTYFPVNNYTDIGSSEFGITDIAVQYDRQIIFKEDQTFYSFADQIEYADGNYDYEYPVYELNQKVGNVAPAQVRLIDNSPVSLKSNNIWLWSNTESKDERNANIVSNKIKLSLLDIDLTQAVTFDYQKLREYWLCIDDEVYIWNYETNTFYKFTNISAKQFILIDGELYFSTNGTLERMGDDLYNDNGEIIHANMELGFSDFGVNNLLKNSRKLWMTIRPADKTSLKLLWQTNRGSLSEDRAIEFRFVLSTFVEMDFSDFSFSTNRNPVPFRKKIRAKKYAYIKFLFKNDEDDETLTLLSLRVEAETNSEVK